MRFNNRLAYRLLSVIAPAWLLLAGGCATDECEGNQNSLPLAGFYSATTSPQKISLDSLTVYGENAPGDSILVNNGSGIGQVYLPFRIDEPTTTFIFKYNQKQLAEQGVEDRITFHYTQVPVFVSAACGVSYFYHISKIDYTRNLIDSVACPGGIITNADKENLMIFFRVSTE